MAVSESFRRFALEQLGRAIPGGVRARAMFGGVGLYAGERFFALLDDDTLYLKADDTTRDAFVGAGLQPFMPFGDATHGMSYYAVPADWLEDAEALRPWVDRALAAAGRAHRRRRSP
jgi:DNA transformation protein